MRDKHLENEQEELIVRSAYEESSGELSSRNPMVLSCGGIYIPREKRRKQGMPLWEILNLAGDASTVIATEIPKSPLNIILDKESKN